MITYVLPPFDCSQCNCISRRKVPVYNMFWGAVCLKYCTCRLWWYTFLPLNRYNGFSRSDRLLFPADQISWMSDWVSDRVCKFCPWARSTMEGAAEMKLGIRVVYRVRMIPKHRMHAQRGKARDTGTTLDDEKWNRPRRRALHIGRTCVVLTAFCTQPETFTLHIGGDQSAYLLYIVCVLVTVIRSSATSQIACIVPP